MIGPYATLFILVVLSALSYLDRGVISLLVNPISRDLGVSDFQISLLQGAAFGIFYSVFSLPFGAIADRWSRRWLIVLGVTLWSLAQTACGVAADFNQLLLARFFVGAGEAALYPAALSLIGDLRGDASPERFRSSASAWLSAPAYRSVSEARCSTCWRGGAWRSRCWARWRPGKPCSLSPASRGCLSAW